MSIKKNETVTERHLVIVGFGKIVCKYLSCIQKAIDSEFIGSYSIIELDSKKTEIEERVRQIDPKPTKIYYVPDSYAEGSYANQKDFEPIFKKIRQSYRYLKVYIATEVKAHEDYLRYCVVNNIDSLVEKPVLAPMKNREFKPELINSAMQKITNLSLEKSAKHSVMTLSRYHKIYNEKVLEPLKQKMVKLNAPLTSFHLRYSGGVWNLHKEYEEREDHPYKYGYGVIMHGGYHYIDLAVQFLKLNKLIFTDSTLSLTISSYGAYPNDQNDRIPKEFSEYFDDDYPDWPFKSDHSKYGETDIVTTFCLKKKDTEKIITLGTISLEQTTPSLRMCKDLPSSVCNKNGRVASTEVEAQLSTLHSVNVQCFDVPEGNNGEIDKISAFARISRRTNISLLKGERYNVEETYKNFFHSDSNRELMSAWLKGEEDKSRLAEHVQTMKMVQYMALSLRKHGHPITFDL